MVDALMCAGSLSALAGSYTSYLLLRFVAGVSLRCLVLLLWHEDEHTVAGLLSFVVARLVDALVHAGLGAGLDLVDVIMFVVACWVCDRNRPPCHVCK